MPASESFQHFQVLRKPDGSLWELGRGAMGVTYKAFDTNLRSQVALKVINAQHLDSDTARQRFLREARAAAGMSHPNVATVFHLGESGGDYFYAMEFIDGETVESFVARRGALPAVEALKITLQVARALRAAERVGLVHRDIKPANLMLVHEDENDPAAFEDSDAEPHLKVIDFGLAKAVEKDAATATITIGGFVGTPHYASPEQLEERSLDVRSDIYSLGITLWYMLAGKPPFGGTIARIMSQHLGVTPPFEDLANQPSAVVTLLKRMLEKDPVRRQQNASDLRREIEQTLRSLGRPGDDATAPLQVSAPTLPPPDTENRAVYPLAVGQPGAMRGSRPLVLFTMVVVVVAALTGVGGYFGYRYFSGAAPLDKPVRRAEPVPKASPFATALPITLQTPAPPSPAAVSTVPTPVPVERPVESPVSPPPTPVPTPDRAARYKEIMSEVQQMELAGHTGDAIDGYVRLVADYPEYPQSAARLDTLVNGLKTGSYPADTDAALRAPMERAANAGSVAAMLFLGEHFLRTEPASAIEWDRKAADQGRPEAMVALGDLYFRGVGVRQDQAQAVRWYQLASDKGYAKAKVYLAECYETGEGGLPRDLNRMFALLKDADAIEPANPATAEKLALAYEHGWGASMDPKLAFEWMKRAVDGGLTNALGNLGSYYMRGVGTKPDTKAAVALFKQGADKNNAACLFFYAQCFEQGIGGMTVDRTSATEFYRRSASQGFAPAKLWCTQHKVSFTLGR